MPAEFELFSNYDRYGEAYPRPNTLLIDSQQLESGDALDPKFRDIAGNEIERFRREIQERTGQHTEAADIDEAALLREVMNTVGEKGRLGESIRCVVSVSMLSEGWDCNTVTHILGVRAFGTQLLCEQVVGRALRRRNYELNDDGCFDTEYADILGIPFNFASEAVQVAPKKPVERTVVKAVRPEREKLEIRFPRVQGYRTEQLPEKVRAVFTDDHTMRLTPADVGATRTGKVRSDDTDGIACWFLDTNYNGESFFVRHAYFLGANDPYKSLKRTLKAEIDREAWESSNSNVSRPFFVPETGRITVKIINHLGDEVMKVMRVG